MTAVSLPRAVPMLHYSSSQCFSSPSSSPCASPEPRKLRRGKWTPEEEQYAGAIIRYFLDGVLGIQYGTTLRGYLAQLLHCDPMRVSKKLVPGSLFAGVRIDPKIGRRAYYPCANDVPDLRRRHQQAAEHLSVLRRAFCASVAQEEAQERRNSAFVMEQTTNAVHVGQKRGRAGAIDDFGIGLSLAPVPLFRASSASSVSSCGSNTSACLPSLNDVLKCQRVNPPNMSVPMASPCLPPLRVSLIRAASASTY